MEYNINSFVNRLRELFINSKQFPLSGETYIDKNGRSQKISEKHKNRKPLHLKSIAETTMSSTMVSIENMISFDFGSEELEKNYPHYHILQNTPYIRKANNGTKKTRGTQAYVQDVGKRDYEYVYFNGKTFTKEYSRNVRGKRNRIGKVSQWQNGKFINRDSNSYLNIHYNYIDKILEEITPILANEYGMKLGRVKSSGLIDEFAEQEGISVEQVKEIFSSFMD